VFADCSFKVYSSLDHHQRLVTAGRKEEADADGKRARTQKEHVDSLACIFLPPISQLPPNREEDLKLDHLPTS